MIAPGLFFLNSGVRPWSKVAPTGVRPQSKVAGDCTLAPDPGAAPEFREQGQTRGLRQSSEEGGTRKEEGEMFHVSLGFAAFTKALAD